MNATLDDQGIYQQIEQLSDSELRGVIKYLVLLNAEAVENALNYTFQQRPASKQNSSDVNAVANNNNAKNATTTTTTTSVEDSFEAEFTSEFEEEEQENEKGEDTVVRVATNTNEDITTVSPNLETTMPPLLQKSRRSQSTDEGLDEDIAALQPPSHTTTATTAATTAAAATTTNTTTTTTTPEPSDAISTDSSVMTAPISNTTSTTTTITTATPPPTRPNSRRRLMVLCSMKPSTNQQAIDQDDAMVFCKQIGILPFIVLAESKPEKTRELTKISKISKEYPQFFLSNKNIGNHHDPIEYLGSLDLMRTWKKDGTLTCEQDLYKIPITTQEEEVAAAPSKRQLTFHDKDTIMGEQQHQQQQQQRQGSSSSSSSSPISSSSIPEHLQSRNEGKEPYYPPASDLYHHLLNLAQPPTTDDASTFGPKKPDSERDEDGDTGPLEPPEGGYAVLQDKNGNRREEPPARSPPTSAKKPARPSPGTENAELSTTEPPYVSAAAPPATPNLKAQVSNIAEPPALSPPKTTTKAQRRVLQQETDGHAPSTPNAQQVKKYHHQHQDNAMKPEPTPGGNGTLRKEAVPLEPPSAHKASPTVAVAATAGAQTTAPQTPQAPPLPSMPEDVSTGKYVPEPSSLSSPGVVETKGNDSSPPLDVTPEIPGYKEHEQDVATGGNAATATTSTTAEASSAPPQSPADDQVLSILNGVGACYLVYDEQDAGNAKLNIYYSETPMDHAVGVWSSTDITDFKQAQGLGSNEFIGNCATECQQSPSNYFKGWSQFVKAAKSMNGTVITLTKYGMPIEFYTYQNNGGDAICEKVPGIQFETAGLDAIACLPKGANFDYQTLRARKWSKQAKKMGAVATFNSLVHNSGVSASSPNKAASTTLPSPAVASDFAKEDKPAEDVSQTMEDVNSIPVREPKEGYPSAMEAPCPEGGACYLVYEPGSSGRLVEQFSKTPVAGAIGRWVPGPGKKISGFKFKQNHGKSVLIGNCSAGKQGRKNYCSGWNQFVRSAKIQNGEVILWDPEEGVKGMAVDVWLYTNDNRPGHQSLKLERGVSTSVESILAVTAIPKDADFFEGISVDMLRWLAQGSTNGASSKFE